MGYAAGVDLRTVEDVVAWLEAMPAADAVRVARLLTDGQTAVVMRQHADQRVYDLTREMKAEEVSKLLDTSLKSVRRAAERERDRRAGRPLR